MKMCWMIYHLMCKINCNIACLWYRLNSNIYLNTNGVHKEKQLKIGWNIQGGERRSLNNFSSSLFNYLIRVNKS